MGALPSEYDQFHPYQLVHGRRYLIFLVETVRYKKASPRRGCIKEYDLLKLCNEIIDIASDGRVPNMKGSFQSYVKRFSNYNPYRNEKYYDREKHDDGIYLRYRIKRLLKRIETEKNFSKVTYNTVYRKHGVFTSPGRTEKTQSDIGLYYFDSIGQISDSAKCTVTKGRLSLFLLFLCLFFRHTVFDNCVNHFLKVSYFGR
jgi:hypothetical protein